MKLKELRNKIGLSQQELAKKINCSQTSIYRYENNLAEPDIKTLIELAKVFGISVDELVGADTPMLDLRKFDPWNRKIIDTIKNLPPKDAERIFGIIDGYLKDKG